MTAALSAAALDVLATATAAEDRVTLPARQLDRKVYQEVDRALSRLGGRWDRRARAHLFPADPRDDFAALLDDGRMPVDQVKAMAYWRTPDQLADDMAARLNLPACASVLEPSAGDGALVAAVLRRCPTARVAAVEPDRSRFDEVSMRASTAWCMSFEEFTATITQAHPIDAVIMNPPFSVPGNRTIYVDHIDLAWRMVRSGGRLVAIAPDGLRTGRTRKVAELRDRIERAGGGILPLPEDTFREAGTAVRTVLVDVPGGHR